MSITTNIESRSASRVSILDPKGDAQENPGGASPRLTSFDGKKVGIVIDGPWRSWYLFSEVLEKRLREREITTERLSVNRLDINEDDLELDNIRVDLDDSAIEKLASEIDAVIVGLGN
jgi:hypothetical protein